MAATAFIIIVPFIFSNWQAWITIATIMIGSVPSLFFFNSDLNKLRQCYKTRWTTEGGIEYFAPGEEEPLHSVWDKYVKEDIITTKTLKEELQERL
mgnify:CR=1 FL=1